MFESFDVEQTKIISNFTRSTLSIELQLCLNVARRTEVMRELFIGGI